MTLTMAAKSPSGVFNITSATLYKGFFAMWLSNDDTSEGGEYLQIQGQTMCHRCGGMKCIIKTSSAEQV